ncbi:DUF2092 domain-containing protein [Methylolobus aquaticus]
MNRHALRSPTGVKMAVALIFASVFAGPAGAESGKPTKQQAQAKQPATVAPAAATVTPQVSAQADRILQDMSDYLKAANEFSVRAEILYDDLLPSGQKLLFSGRNDIAVHRPDRLYSHSTGDTGDKRLWFDGKQITLLDDRHGVYATEKAPGTIDATLDHLIKELHFTPPLSDLLYSDPHAVLRRGTLYGFHVGISDVGGHRCHHLAFIENSVDWQIWIDDGLMRVPRKLAITYKTLPGAPQFIATLTDWNFTARFADSVFVPALPPSAQRIEFLKAAAGPATNVPAKGAK